MTGIGDQHPGISDHHARNGRSPSPGIHDHDRAESVIRLVRNTHVGENARGQLFCRNLMAEIQIEGGHWSELVEVLGCSWIGAEEIQLAITRRIRSSNESLQLQGRVAGRALGRPLVRVALASSLEILVGQEDPNGMTRRQVKSLVAGLVHVEPGALPGWLRDIRLGRSIMWSTYDTGPIGSSQQASLLACRLGLDNNPHRSDSWLVLEYELPGDVVPRVPTIFDAYGGWPWPYYFLTADRKHGEIVGHTLPRRDCADFGGFPEVVHRPVVLGALCRPLRIFPVGKLP